VVVRSLLLLVIFSSFVVTWFRFTTVVTWFQSRFGDDLFFHSSPYHFLSVLKSSSYFLSSLSTSAFTALKNFLLSANQQQDPQLPSYVYDDKENN